ncbi:uncharacterized protein ATC70_005342 [Mucor velutinosus]|uniref:Uncharacterized protein n=1 Tax=Mucor velutinosus TaxID=708070 RepID=A0AAN7D9P2_9FUNG|nr:hypothetical protein ATC70_005342 [Mucor velutinosus]
MRNFIFTKAQLLSLRSLGPSFINIRIFPKLSFRTLQQPRHHGGHQVLDPIVRQEALQWRWICPLILVACHSPLLPTYTTPSTSALQYTLQQYFNSTTFSDYFYYLLFPAAGQAIWLQHRPSPTQAFLNTLTNVITAMDRIPCSFTTCHLDSHTRLSLPFLEIILYTLPSTHPHFSSFTAPDHLFNRHPGVQELLAIIDVLTYDAVDLQVIRVGKWSVFELACYLRASRRVATSPIICPFIRRLLKPAIPPPPRVPLIVYNTINTWLSPTSPASTFGYSHHLNSAPFGNQPSPFNLILYDIASYIAKSHPELPSIISFLPFTPPLHVHYALPNARRIFNTSSLLAL